MSKKMSTKRALVSSVLALLVCVSMLIGTTFAWFTDNVTSGHNTIQSGNLDVELYYALTAEDVAAENWTKVTKDTDIFGYDSWEPGYTQVAYFKVANEGSLALKYQLTADVYSEILGKTKEGADIRLSEFLKYGVTDELSLLADRDAAAAVATTSFGSFEISESSLLKNQSKVIGMVITMPTTVGNEANHNGKDIPAIEFGVNLFATQLTYESDSFGNDYDDITLVNSADTLRAAFAEGGNVLLANDIVVDADTTITVTAGKTVNLDLNGYEIKGISDETNANRNLFDVNGGTLNVINGTVTFEHVGANMGWGHSTNNFNVTAGGVLNIKNAKIENLGGSDMAIGVHLNNWGEVTLNADNVEFLSTYTAIRAFNSGYDMNNITVTNSTITGASMAFWVHNYTAADFGASYDADAVNARLNVNLLAENPDTNNHEDNLANLNAEANNVISGKIRYGFTDGVIYYSTSSRFVAEGLYNDVNNNKKFYVTSAKGLANFAKWRNSTAVTEGSPLSVWCELTADIDMAGVEYTSFDGHFTEFNGNGHTIKNLKNKQGKSGKGGLVSYLGGGVIKNVTLEDATVTGCQVGLFAGQSEGGKIENCFVKGNNTVIWTQNTTSNYVETWGGIGAIVGYNSGGTFNVEITDGANVTIIPNGMVTEGTFRDDFTGYGLANGGTVTNNGTITVAVKNIAEFRKTAANENYSHNVSLLADMAGDVKVAQPNDKEIDMVIDGNGYKFDGTIEVWGYSQNGNDTLTIKNINFVTETAEEVFIWSYDSANKTNPKDSPRYVHNLTIDSCTFTASGAAVHSAASIKLLQMYNIKITNCTANNMHSLLQSVSCDNTVEVVNATVNNCKNGVSFNTTKNAIIRNSNIKATDVGGYGIRHEGSSDNYALTIENCNIEAYVPVLVRKVTANNIKLDFVGAKGTLTAGNADGYQVIVSNSDVDEAKAPTTPTGTFTVTGANGYRVFPN